MHRKELNERSPMRVLEQSIHGGLGRGNIGVVIARPGVGKTAFLVGVALDELLRGRNVLHVSLDDPIDKVAAYYDEIYVDLAHEKNLEDQWQARLYMERHRRILCYLDGSFNPAKLAEAIEFWGKHGDFAPVVILLEGFDFAAAGRDELDALRSIARDCNSELWMSATTHRDAERNDHGVPQPVAHVESHVDVILTMAGDGKGVQVGIQKDHDNQQVSDLKISLDPRTMLVIKETA